MPPSWLLLLLAAGAAAQAQQYDYNEEDYYTGEWRPLGQQGSRQQVGAVDTSMAGEETGAVRLREMDACPTLFQRSSLLFCIIIH